MKLEVSAVQTKVFRSGESLSDFIVNSVEPRLIHESMVLAITSKIVSLAENRLVPKDSISKSELIDREADVNLGPIAYGSILTIKEGMMIASAGIDESNSETGSYILYPEHPFESARIIHAQLCERWNLGKLGIILTDSRTSPLRLGVTGVSLAYWGFRGLQDKVGQKDLFGQPLVMTKINLADGLAAAATLVMGEANESSPLAVLSGFDLDFQVETHAAELRVDPQDDLYYPFFMTSLPKNRK